MKKPSLFTILAGVMLVSTLHAFGQENKKAAEARKEVATARENLREAKLDSAADFQTFKKQSEKRIAENQQLIAEANELHQKEIKASDDQFSAKVTMLQAKNDQLKKQLGDSDKVKTTQWTTFKYEFNRDLDDLGKAFKDFMKSNNN